MAQPRSTEKVPVADKPARKRLVIRNRSGKFLGSGGDDVTEVKVTQTRYRRLWGNRTSLEKVVSSYADVLAEAEKTGRPMTFTVRVSPDGAAEAVKAPTTASDALDVALKAAQARGSAKVADILKQPDMLTAKDFGALIGASHETVHAKRKRFEVLGLEGTTRGVRFPAWQVTDEGLPLPGLPEIFAALNGQPWAVYRVLRQHHAELKGRTGLEALKAGDLAGVLNVANNIHTGAFA